MTAAPRNATERRRPKIVVQEAERHVTMPGCKKGNTFPMKVGTTAMMNSSIAASSRKDPMIPPPPIIQTFLPACVRRRSAKAPIDSVSAASHQANRNVRQEQVREARRHEPSGK